MAINMENFVLSICEKDTKKLLKTGQDLIDFFKTNNEVIDYQQLPFLVDGLIQWLHNSNFRDYIRFFWKTMPDSTEEKIVLNGLEVLRCIVTLSKNNFTAHVASVAQAAMDKLGDQKDQVREASQNLLMALMEDTASPQVVFEKLVPTAFIHKQWHVREEVLITLQNILNKFGSCSITTSRYVPAICKLLQDPNSQVRDQAHNTLVQIYGHVGDRFKMDLVRKNLVPAPKLASLLEKFEEMRNAGRVPAPTDREEEDAPGSYQDDRNSEMGNDETDGCIPCGSKGALNLLPKTINAEEQHKGPVSRSISAPPVKRGLGQHIPGSKVSSPAPTSAGAMDEESFYEAFEDVPKIQVTSLADLEEIMSKIRELLATDKIDWNKRNDEMRKLRALVLAGASDYPEFFTHLRLLEPALQLALKDLRSQIVREVCLTVAFFAQVFGIKFEHCAEYLLSSLISLMSNTVKIMSTSGVVAIKFIIRHVHSHRLIPILVTSMASKSREIRRNCCDFLDHLLHTWETSVLEKHTALLQEAIRKGLQDADAEARASSRKAYWGFADHFKDMAEALLLSLDPGKQRMLRGEVSNSSSSNSLHRSHRQLAGIGSKPFTSHKNSLEDLGKTPGGLQAASNRILQHVPFSRTLARGDRAQHAQASSSTIYGKQVKAGASTMSSAPLSVASSSSTLLTKRSTSAIDSQAAARSRRRHAAFLATRASKAEVARAENCVITDTLPRLTHKSNLLSGSSTKLYNGVRSIYAPLSTAAVKTSKSSSSMSQPGSRSTSPSPYFSVGNLRANKLQNGSARVRSNNVITFQQNTEMSSTLQKTKDTRDGETKYQKTPNPYKIRPEYDPVYSAQRSDEEISESSSFCSEFSASNNPNYCSYPPHSGSSSPRPNLYVGTTDLDSSEILSLLTNANWSERKEGLIHIIRYLRAGKELKFKEIRPVMDAFSKMFMDPHSKVFSIFLDALSELIRVHSEWMHEWVYTLLAKLLTKMGQELLTSIHTKCQKLLELMRSTFSASLQFHHLCKFITDHTMTPNHKVKASSLAYLYSLVPLLKPSEFDASSDLQIAAMSRVIALTGEPKSLEARKAALHLLLALFNLNPASFTMILNVLPKHQQDTAKAILSQHIKPSLSTDDIPLSPPANEHQPSTQPRENGPHIISHDASPSLNGTGEKRGPLLVTSTSFKPHILLQPATPNLINLSTPSNEPASYYSASATTERFAGDLSRDYDDSTIPDFCLDEKFGQLSFNLPKHSPQIERPVPGFLSTQKPIPPPKPKLFSPNAGQCDTKIPSLAKKRFPQNPNGSPDYENRNGFDMSELTDRVEDVMLEADLEQKLANILSRMNTSDIEFMELWEYLKFIQTYATKAGPNKSVWDRNFQFVFPILLKLLNHPNDQIRMNTLLSLRELIRGNEEHFTNFAEVSYLKLLNAIKDESKEVSRCAEETGFILARTIPPQTSYRVLSPMILTGPYPLNLQAINVLNQVVQHQPKHMVNPLVSSMVSNLIQTFNDESIAVRKASVFCLVSIYMKFGEHTVNMLTPLTPSKRKLLQVYIDRAKEHKSTK